MTIDKMKIGRLLVCIGAVGLSIGIIAYMATRSSDEDMEQEEKTQNAYVEVPEAEEAAIQGSKSAAYRDHREEKEGTAIENYWDRCVEDTTDREAAQSAGGAGLASDGTGKGKTTEELFVSPSPAPRGGSGYTNPYRETPQQREERHQRRHEEAMELAGQMSTANAQEQDRQEEQQEPEDDPAISTVVRRSGGISSMDQWGDDTGISSLDDTTDLFVTEAERPIKCMFARESKIKSGQRTSIILLEDLVVNGTLVPKNTHLMAFCSISGRLEMKVANIEIGGRIIPLGYEAYDNDGSPGIYCPDVGGTGQTVRNRGTRMIGSGLSGKMGRTAGEIISTGVSLIQNASGEKTVTIPAGYTFFIVKKKQ